MKCQKAISENLEKKLNSKSLSPWSFAGFREGFLVGF
jgi:hypothetical protein